METMETIYYDRDANPHTLDGATIGIVGYGIQGRAQALNIRDSGFNVLVSNRQDDYVSQLTTDGFDNTPIDDLARNADAILLLIPDQAQAEVYTKHIRPHMRPGAMLVFAHGFALRFKTLVPAQDIDVALLAPRMPGKQIRGAYLQGGGVPAFVDVIQNYSGQALTRVLALAQAAGFTKAGVLAVDYRVETELDLFIEQFLVTVIVKAIHTGFETLVSRYGFPPMATLMELYASGELAEVLHMAAHQGIGRVFQKNASPTCQFGIAANFDLTLEKTADARIDEIMNAIRDGSFCRLLDQEAEQGYPRVKGLWAKVNNDLMAQTQDAIQEAFTIEALP